MNKVKWSKCYKGPGNKHIINNYIELDRPQPINGLHNTDMTFADHITKSNHLSIQSLLRAWHERERAAAATQHAYQWVMSDDGGPCTVVCVML